MNRSRTQAEAGAPGALTERRTTRRHLIAQSAALFTSLTFVESNAQADSLEVTRHRVPLANLKQPFRAVQITDLHRSQFVHEPFIERIVAETNALNPDLVLLTGDFVTRTSDYAESCMRPLAELRAPLGKYAVLGNHDYWCDGGTGGPVIHDWLEATDIHVLTNRSALLQNGLRLVGVDDLLAGVVNYPLSVADVKSDEPVLAMTHNPGTFYTLCRYNFLTIAGHTHGGQLYIPGISTFLVGSKFLRGWYQFKNYPGRMYISRGLGTIHVPMRICSTPEIAVFDVVPA